MNNNTMDPELAQEMVKLLGQQLKVTRAQLGEANERTTFLEQDNAALQEKIVRLQNELAPQSSVKSEGVSNAQQFMEMPTYHTKADVATILAVKEDLIREKKEGALQLTVLEEKYERMKEKANERLEAVNGLRTKLLKCTQELESRKDATPEIDFRTALAGIPYQPVGGQPELSSIQSYSPNLIKGLRNVCKGPFSINCNEVIWSRSGIALGLVIRHVFQFNPKVNGGAWTRNGNSFGHGKQLDVCYHSGGRFRYLGTYERVENQGDMIIAAKTLKHFDSAKMDYISNRTTLFPNLMPPSQTQMIKNMYKQGVIKLQCFVIRCVAYNQPLAERLRGLSAPSVVPGQRGKRKQDQAAHSTGRKKRKTQY